jgi:hypothetical protein
VGDTLTIVILGAASLVSLICLIVVWIQMFQRGATALALACILLTFCCGVGTLITFVYGWIKAAEWKITNVMLVWTVAAAINIVAGSINPAPIRSVRETVKF